MSCITKMTIQGIRSYGPKDQDTQVIEFFAPVTLIVGQNGSGKTTIIECLKYATTSDMPPNTKGASFLFDPKLIDEVETKGRIKLFFKDMSGLSVQVQKNMASTQKQKKVEFRTLETLISRYDTQNKLVSTITSKCVNADAEVINALGVSKAVLDYVIFCHQEESNWPLSEGKLLKTRFDEIFSATKYTKALDTLRKVRLEKQQQIKLMDNERKHLENYKTRAEQLTRELDDLNRKYEGMESRQNETKEKLKPIQDKINFFMQESGRIWQVKSDMEKIENEIKLLEKQIKELLVATKDCVFQGDDDELKEYIKNFSNTTNKMRREEEEATNERIATLNAQLRQMASNKTKLTAECGAMENKYLTFVEKKKSLAENATRLCALTDLTETDFYDGNNTLDVKQLQVKLNDYFDSFNRETQSIEEENKLAENRCQSDIDSERAVNAKLDQSLQNKQDAIKKFTKQLEQLKDELKQCENNKQQSELTARIEEMESNLVILSDELVDSKKIKEDINRMESERASLKQQESKIDAEVNKWHQSSKIRTEVNMLKNDKKSKLDQIRKIKIRIEEDFESFFDHLNKSQLNQLKADDLKLKQTFEAECRELNSKTSSLEEKRKEIEKRLVTDEAKRKMINDNLRAKQNAMRACEDKLLQVNDLIVSESDIEKFDTILEELNQQHLNLLDEKGFLTGTDKTYKRFLTQLKPECDEQSCPVCMRTFSDSSELNDTISELKKFTNKLPSKINDVEDKIKTVQTKLNDMVNAKVHKEAYDRLKNKEIAELKSQLDSLDRDTLPKLRAELKETESLLKETEKRKQFSEQLQSEIVIIDKYAREGADIDKKLEQINKSIDGSDDSQVDIDELNRKKSSIQTELNGLNESIQQKQDEINKNYARTDKINSVKEKLNELKTKRTELTMKSQKKTQLLEKEKEIKQEMAECQASLQTLHADLKTSVGKLNRLLAEKESIMSSAQADMKKRMQSYDQVRECHMRIKEQIQFVMNFDEAARARLKKEVREVESKERDVHTEIERLRGKLDDIKTELARHDIKQRELNDNLMLREKRAEFLAKRQLLESKQKELKLTGSNIDWDNFKMEEKKVEKKRDELNKELMSIKTEMNMLEGRIQGVRDELEQDHHKCALEKFLQCSSDLKVIELSVIDMDKYYKALDYAIMKWHSMKMSEINKSIKQLWRQVYRGSDIDYIEIRSEEEASGEEATTQKMSTRRSYNYRVVIVKGDTCLDMRGRCSAGQKVLASIIIRLALAETFCLNSGILALDEPTTNLDRENIESLASALVEIIKARSSQRNFQLIIITHDEDFVEMLGRSEYMDQFYRVSKDDNGFSRITKRNHFNL